jgi:hypothetical protein
MSDIFLNPMRQNRETRVGRMSGESRSRAISQNFFVWRAATTLFYRQARQEKE